MGIEKTTHLTDMPSKKGMRLSEVLKGMRPREVLIAVPPVIIGPVSASEDGMP